MSAVATERAPRRRALPWPMLFAGALLALITGAGLGAAWMAPFDPNKTHLLFTLLPPLGMAEADPRFLLGTDELGRDLLSRVLHATRISLTVALIGTVIGATLGTALGLIAGLLGGMADRVVMMLVDIQITLPFLLVVLIGIVLFGTSIETMMMLIGFAGWEGYARILRGQVLALKAQPFVEAAQGAGAGPGRVARVHILPHLVSPLVVLMTLNFPHILVLESTLSFLGIGIQPPTPTLGRMIGEGRNNMLVAWWVVASPAAVMIGTTLAFQTLGDGLRDRLDVKARP